MGSLLLLMGVSFVSAGVFLMWFATRFKVDAAPVGGFILIGGVIILIIGLMSCAGGTSLILFCSC